MKGISGWQVLRYLFLTFSKFCLCLSIDPASLCVFHETKLKKRSYADLSVQSNDRF